MPPAADGQCQDEHQGRCYAGQKRRHKDRADEPFEKPVGEVIDQSIHGDVRQPPAVAEKEPNLDA